MNGSAIRNRLPQPLSVKATGVDDLRHRREQSGTLPFVRAEPTSVGRNRPFIGLL